MKVQATPFSKTLVIDNLSSGVILAPCLLSHQHKKLNLDNTPLSGADSTHFSKGLLSLSYLIFLSFLDQPRLELKYFPMTSASETQALLMRAWMTGLILAIFGLWLSVI